jgi:hypothetical protein
MKSITLLIFMAGLTAATLSACKSTGGASAGIFQAENLAADGAMGATHAFNVYKAQMFPATTPAEQFRILSFQTNLYAADVKLGATLAVTETLREQVATNSTSTNQTALLLTLTALEDQSSNIIGLVRLFLNQTNAP